MSAEDALEAADQLRDAGKVPEALAKYKAARSFAATPATLYALGRAYAETGALAEAYETLTAVASIPIRPNEPAAWNDLRRLASKLAEDLKARTPSVTIALSGVPEGATVTVDIDGKTVDPDTLSTARRLDPGRHVITAQVKGGGAGRAEVDLHERETRALPMRVEAAAGPLVDDEIHVSFVLPEHLVPGEREPGRFVRPTAPRCARSRASHGSRRRPATSCS